jgi:DnaJ-class molecular chaperone
MDLNLYSILEINSKADLNEIKTAYRLLAKKYHPDRNGNDNSLNNKFHAITTAYGILSDPVKKRNYDMTGYISRDDDNTGQTNDQHGGNSRFFEIINSICTKLFQSTESTIFSHLKDDVTLDDLIKNNNNEMATNYVINAFSTHFGISMNEESDESHKYESDCASVSDGKCDSMDIVINLDTNIEEVYQGCIKVVTFERQVLQGSKMIVQKTKLNVPVCNDKTIFDNEGNDYMDNDNKLIRSNVIVIIKCLHSDYYKRINDYDMMIITCLTDEEVENGYNKTLKYFEKTIKIKCKNPGEKMINGRVVTRLSGHGIKYYKDGNYKSSLHGDLIIVSIKKK